MKTNELTIAIAGASGFLGRALEKSLKLKGHRVKKLVRYFPQKSTAEEVYWNPESGHIERVGLEGVDVLINLAGAGIAKRRWSPARKELLTLSRVRSTQLLVHSLSKLKNPPSVFLNASAIGYYGNQPGIVCDEASPAGTGFLSELCQEWEEAAKGAEKLGIRTLFLRTSNVLGKEGGYLSVFRQFLRLRLQFQLGAGNHVFNWIALSDWLLAVERLMLSQQSSGPYNLVSPNTVTTLDFNHRLREVVGRTLCLRITDQQIRWIFGEMGESLLLCDTKVFPSKLQAEGFAFEYADPKSVLMSIFGPKA